MHDSTIYSLLLSPRYRALRYAMLCFMFLVFSCSETLYHYQHVEPLAFFLFTLNGFLCKLMFAMILIIVLFPLLLRKKYFQFWVHTLISLVAFVWLQHIVFENLISHYFNIQPWKESVHTLHIWIDIMGQFAVWFLALLGIVMGRMFKYWNNEYENTLHIQASKIRMETDSMKEQVTPSLFCSALRKGGEYAGENPKETSDILMRLSRLLRYQLYDSRHEKVLLDSEIKFLREYLAILKYTDGCAGFNISVSGETMGLFIYPLLFVPFLQSEGPADKDAFIEMGLQVENDCLTFELAGYHIQRNEGSIRNRLEQLYPKKYELDIQPKYVLFKILIR